MTDLTRDQLQEIIRWWPLLDDVADSLVGVTGNGMDLAGVHVAGGTSGVEVAIIQLEEIQAISIDLTALARKMGWRAGLDGTARHYIHANLAWARQNLAPADYEPTITDLHNRIARHTGHAPRPTNRQCPMCGEALRLIPPDRPTWHTTRERKESSPDQFICDGCDETRTAQEIDTLLRWRISQADYAPVPLAARILGIPASTIRKWIERGQLTREPDGTINIPHTRQLAERNTQ